jgi:hypothetical protein
MFINLIEKYKVTIFILITLFLSPLICFASDQIKVECSVSNIKEPTDLTVDYVIIPDPSNLTTATNEPTNLTLIINKNDRIVDQKVDKNIYIDFNDTVYNDVGLYKYIIEEENISNEADYNLTNKKYEIYVQAVYDSEGNIIKNILLFGTDLSDNEKKPVKFAYKNVNDEIIIDIPKTDKNIYRLPIVLLILSIAFIIIILGKRRKYDQQSIESNR